MMMSWGRGLLFREKWRVPRSIVCGMFWMAVFFLFVGMILLVISKHKGRAYVVWGGILLGLGFCIVLVCFLLCLNAYRILAQKNKLPQTISQSKNLAIPSSTSIIHPSTPSSQRPDYAHIFVPIHPSSKFETSPALKRSDLDQSVSFNIPSNAQVTPSRKKKVRLQNGDTFHHDGGRMRDDVIVPGNTWMTRSSANFSNSREVNFETPPAFSIRDTSKLNAEIFRGEKNANRSKSIKSQRIVDGRAEYLTDDEIHCKRRENDTDVHPKSHSRTLSHTFKKTEEDRSSIENAGGSMRVKVRPIKSRLYTPDWVADNDQQTGKIDTMNVIHF